MIQQCEKHEESGYKKVEVVSGFCEVGGDCPVACVFAWRGRDVAAAKAFERAFPEPKQYERGQWQDE